MKDSPAEFAHAYEAVNRLAALVLGQDSAAMMTELENVAATKKAKVKASTTGGQA
jgi:hypothetical protein